MKLGFAVKVLGNGGLPSHDTRRWQSEPHLGVSLERLDAILDYLDAVDIRMYRVASALAPYASHPDMPQFHRQVDECAEDLAAIGAKVRRLGIRLSSHPGQYTVLNSAEESVVDAAIGELEVHAAVFDAMELGREAVVVIHVGARREGNAEALAAFEKGFARLSPSAQARLVVENDDRSFDVVAAGELTARIDRPVVWDTLHHRCLNPHGVGDAEALDMALSTWPREVTPKVHFSSPRLDMSVVKKRVGRRVQESLQLPPLRAHADLVDAAAFEALLALREGRRDFDVMLEAKAKDLAVLRLRGELAARGHVLG